MKSEQNRQRAFVVVAIICGSLAATLMWRSLHPVASLTDAQAQKLGFASNQDQRDTDAFFKRVVTGTLSPTDFADAHEQLLHGSFSRRTTIAMGFGYLKGPEQHRLAIEQLDGVEIDSARRPVWLQTFQKWVRWEKDRSALGFLLASKNTEVVQLAKELKNES